MAFYFLYLLFIAILCGRYSITNSIRIVNRRLGFNLAIITIIFVTSLRFNIGYDWNIYFSWIYPVFKPVPVNAREPLNRWIYYIANYLNQPLIVFTTYAFIIYGTVGKSIRDNSVDEYESLIIYMALFYLISLSSMRQHAAAAICLWGFRYIKDKKPFKYIFVCLIAMLAHKSAILALLVYPLYYIPRKYIIIIGTIFFLGFRIILPRILGSLFPVYLMYINSEFASKSGNLVKLFYTALLLYITLFHSKDNDGFFNICFVGVVLLWCLGGMTGERAGRYFLIYFIFALPSCNRKFSIQYRILFLIPFYLYFFFYLYTTISKNNSKQYVPFRWYFLEDLNQLVN